MGIGSMLGIIITLFISLVLIMSYTSWHTKLAVKDSIVLTINSYLKSVETAGCFTDELQEELEEELKRLLYQWMIRSKSVKTVLQAVGVCGVSGKNCGLMIAKLAETFRYKISGEY